MAGCQTLSKSEKITNSPTPKSPPQNSFADYNPISKLTGNSLPKGRPDSIVAIWKDATYTVSAQQPTRGFGGRLYFYDRSKNPIVVDGELVIYGFKDDKLNPEKIPEKRFVFTREDLPNHMSVSSVGPSYNVWLPWDHINGEQKNVTIIALFKESGSNGRVCRSEAIPALLPGTKPAFQEATADLIEEIRAKEAIRSNVKKVGFEQSKPAGTQKVKTHEIRIPSGAQQRLFGNVPTTEYRLPEPKIRSRNQLGTNNREPANSAIPRSSTGSLPGQRQAQTGQFVRQGKLPPGKQLPRLGPTSYPAKHR
jgi:hypothetical protein